VALPKRLLQLIVKCSLPANTPANVPVSCTIDAPPQIVGKDSVYPFSGQVWALRAIKVLSAPSPDVTAVINKDGGEIFRSSPFSLIAGKVDKTELITTVEAVYNERNLLSFQAIPLANVGSSKVDFSFFVEVGVF
jgi:hypothetical protein